MPPKIVIFLNSRAHSLSPAFHTELPLFGTLNVLTTQKTKSSENQIFKNLFLQFTYTNIHKYFVLPKHSPAKCTEPNVPTVSMGLLFSALTAHRTNMNILQKKRNENKEKKILFSKQSTKIKT